MKELKEEYKKSLENAKKLIEDNQFIRIFSHYDADGVSSASILVAALSRKQKRFHVSFLKQLDLKEINSEKDSLVIISDLGADGLNPEDFKVILVDHHEPPVQNENIINLNPRSYGYDGTLEACSSTVAFLLALELDPSNKDLSKFFLSGAIGDKQGVGGFRGINSSLIESLELKPEKTLNLNGLNILEAITYSIDPFFENLSGKEENVLNLLNTINIDKDSKLSSLTEDQMEKLNNILFLELLSGNVSKEGFDSLIGDNIVDEKSGLSVSHLSLMLDSSGRNGRMGLPVAYALGDNDSLEEMAGIERAFRSKVIDEARRSISAAYEMKNINVLEVKDESMTGLIASIGMIYYLNKDKPTVSFFRNAKCKISSRATHYLISRGINLSKGLSKACEEVGGHGGGHDIAAGGTVPLEKLEEFLSILDKIIGDQIGNTKESSQI